MQVDWRLDLDATVINRVWPDRTEAEEPQLATCAALGADATHAERLDPLNGLLQVPNLDKAFDTGCITFGKAGKIQCSPTLVEPEKVGISPIL